MANLLSFNQVEYSYPASLVPVVRNLRFELGESWTGVTGGNGAGKTTLLLLAAGLLTPGAGVIRGPESRLYCPQRTDRLWEDERFRAAVDDFFFSGGNEAGRLMNTLRIEWDWPERWDSLSHGERKRLQVAAALFSRPRVLALDEPANHLDRESRELVAGALAAYEGIGLLVSHDRALLDRLCSRCLFLEDGAAVLRPGNASAGLIEDEREQLNKRRERKNLRVERERLAAEAENRLRTVAGSRKRLSQRRVAPKDHDTRGKIRLAVLTGKDKIGADLYKRMENRRKKADEALEEARFRAERPTGLTLHAEASRADRLLFLPAGELPLGGERRLRFPDLTLAPRDRVALMGPNGAGKSTLIRHLLERLPKQGLLYMPQELSVEQSADLFARLGALDEQSRGEVLSRFSRLGSDPRSLLQSAASGRGAPSPGEARKLLTAYGVLQNPALIIMDEPTNHLDLQSIQVLESLLSEADCALLLVSHDEVFLSRLTTRSWLISTDHLSIQDNPFPSPS
ncbi:MAG: ATP-binding cassette domain-containing protein [Spirochaetaceae bacterium]|jgi:ATPase subunit of ABC transporter with duplicated ATPase domains|nr:ATP-binding cassette domain-containing protein [Spirochaetaceae bacterium]